MKQLIREYGFLARLLLLRYSKTQSLTVYQQLQAGVRMLDIRVSITPGNRVHVYHGLYGNSLQHILQQVHRFIQRHPKEVIRTYLL